MNVEEVILITLVFETNILFNKTIIKKRHVKKSMSLHIKKIEILFVN